MDRSRLLAIACLLLAALVSPAVASAETGILAFSGETLHWSPPGPLIAFGAGRALSIVPVMPALVQHGAQDGDIVLVSLGSGHVWTAPEDLADHILYAEDGIGRDVAKLLREPGSVLLFETSAGVTDPESASQARLAEPSGVTHLLHPARSYTPVPEPGRLAGLAAGAALLYVLGRRRRQ